MLKWLRVVAGTLSSLVNCRRDLALENLALRQQKQAHPRPRLSGADRVFWMLHSKIWHGWRSALHVVQPQTVSLASARISVLLALDRRRILHFNVTEHPTAAWTARQLLEACGPDAAPGYLIRDRDGIYGEDFHRQARALEIDEVPTAPQSPWQNPYAERAIGSIRRECLDQMIVLSAGHLRRILSGYALYYNRVRTHLSLSKLRTLPRGEPLSCRSGVSSKSSTMLADCITSMSEWRPEH